MNAISRVAIAASVLLAVSIPSFAQQTTRSIVDSNGREIIVRTGMPAAQHYGPKPAFAQPPLLNDFDFLAHGAERISQRQYAQWDYH